MILKNEILDVSQTDDLALVFPCDAMICLLVIHEKADEVFDRNVRCDSSKEIGLTAVVPDNIQGDDAVSHRGMVWRIVVPKVVFDAMYEGIRIHHLRGREFLDQRTT